MRFSPTAIGCALSRHSAAAHFQSSIAPTSRPRVCARQSAFSQPESHQSGTVRPASRQRSRTCARFRSAAAEMRAAHSSATRKSDEGFAPPEDVGEPGVGPFADGRIPDIGRVFLAFDAEKAFHPNKRGRLEQRLRVAHAERLDLVWRRPQREVVFVRGLRGAAAQIGCARLENAGGF